MPHFAQPVWFLLLLLPIGLILWRRIALRGKRLELELSFVPSEVDKMGRIADLLVVLPKWLLLLGYCCLVLTLARPQLVEEVQEEVAEGIQLVLALDVSESMETTDYVPNRLEVARQVATQLLDRLQHDRVGLVVFAEGAFTYAPLTQDYAYLKRMIADLRPGMLPKQGTALGDAIAVAAMQLAETNSSGRAIVLLSDGAGNRGLLSSADAAQYALRQQIRTYALGIGLPTLPDTLADPAARGKLTALNLKALETLANVGGGLFLEATQPNALDQLLRHLATLPRTTLGSTPRPVIREVYPWPLGIALVALALAFLLQSLGLGNSLED